MINIIVYRGIPCDMGDGTCVPRLIIDDICVYGRCHNLMLCVRSILLTVYIIYFWFTCECADIIYVFIFVIIYLI